MKAHTVLIVSLVGEAKFPVTMLAQLPFTWTGRIREDDLERPEEIRGAPLLKDLFGPTNGGPGVIRYETMDAAEALSR